MHVMIGLSVATGLPWQYWARQDDRVVATALGILSKASKARRGARADGPAEPQPMMSG